MKISRKYIVFTLISFLIACTIACQSPTVAPTSSLNLEFGTCLGQISQSTSCSSQIFRPLQRGPIGCWALTSPQSDQSFRTRLNWNGTTLELSDPLALSAFPFTEGEQANMYLFLFDSLETARLCDAIDLNESCDNTTGCVTKLSRSNLSLSFNKPLGFQNEFNQCLVETPKINSVELCDDLIDSDCDGVIDEDCIMPGECVPNDIRICENACGRSEQRCVDGVYTSCQMPVEELCTTGQSVEAEDEDCDGVVDEGCGACDEGESRACSTACGMGTEYCRNGSFQACDAPVPATEVCGDEFDNDCDERIDEDCADCIDGSSRACFTMCGQGEELCQNGEFTACNAPLPSEEVCGDQIDNDCDQNTDEGCPSCMPSPESCDGLDNDCDRQVDEGTIANEACLATRANCGGQVPGFIICDSSGAQRCIPNESLFTVGDELCDGVDNDCDGLVDNLIGLNMSCNGEIDQVCAYSRLSCTPGELGVLQAPTCNYEQVPAEVCDGLDNDCNGETDEMDLSQNSCVASCNRSGRQRCENGEVVCDPIEALPEELCGDGIDNNCNGQIDENCCLQQEALCDGLDDDCDGEVDERICGRLLYEHCEVRLAWWQNTNFNTNYAAISWSDWPPLEGYSQYCSDSEDLDRPLYSCDVARAQSNFQTIIIGSTTVGNGHWLGLGWSCEADPQLSPYHQNLVEWAHSSCHIALAYQDIGDIDDIETLNKSECPQYSQYSQSFVPRCIQTQASHHYSAIELEGGVNYDDTFALAFYCDAAQTPNLSVDDTLVQSFQDQFQVYFGVDHRNNDPYPDGVARWHNLPANDRDDSGNVRGVGTLADGQWNEYNLHVTLRSADRMSVMTYIRPVE